MNDIFKNNEVTLSGEIISGFDYSHEMHGEKFYMFTLRTPRLSGEFDYIPVMVSERLVDVKKDYTGTFTSIVGQFRSYNRHDEDKSRLVLSVFAREINITECEELECEELEGVQSNQVFLDGYVCKPTTYRKTPFGREITDVLLAVNRPYGKSDYIPCILWGRNAKFAGNFEVGQRVRLWGRIQSREFQKKLSESEYETRTAYEVSASKVAVVVDEN